MQIYCKLCDEPIKDGSTVKAVFETEYKFTASKVSYALKTPEKCTAVFHVTCWLELMEDEEEEIN